MSGDAQLEVISCSSTRDRHSFGPACHFVWGELEWYASVAEVRRTAGGVQISRGGKVLDMDTASALRLGQDWLTAAEASDSDSLFGQVVERAGLLSELDVDALFGYLADIRSGAAAVPPAKGDAL